MKKSPKFIKINMKHIEKIHFQSYILTLPESWQGDFEYYGI